MKQGRVFVVGIGPGEPEMMTGEVRECLEKCDVIAGYTLYVDLVRNHYPNKDVFTTGMRGEIERCRACYELADAGKDVALVCSGDAGVYGMAAPVLELGQEFPATEVYVLPGITAANSGAAVLGAPLNHDYCVISLSDLLTPWEVIKRRVRAAVQGDFCIAVYNPSSRKRADYLRRMVDIMLDAGAEESRACGYVENIGRAGTRAITCTLSELRDAEVNMFTTVYVGNSATYIQHGRMITPRGYKL